MRRLYIVVEGQTEQSFVNEVLAPYLYSKGVISVVPIIIQTSRIGRGGFVNYIHLKNKIRGLLSNRNASDIIVTTFVDFFRMPTSMPNYVACMQGPFDSARVECLEKAMEADINDRRFVPYIQLHEFEALLFSNNLGFEYLWGSEVCVKTMEIISNFSNPEDINSSPETAPSKRLLAIKPDYDKVVEGTLIAIHVGINEIISKCPRFASWLNSIIQACLDMC